MRIRRKHINGARKRLEQEQDFWLFSCYFHNRALRDWSGWPLVTLGQEVFTSDETDPSGVNACYWTILAQAESNRRARDQQNEENRRNYRRLQESIADSIRAAIGGNNHAADLQTLGLSTMPDLDGLKAAYRKMAMQHHPDKGGDQKAFIGLHGAYERLEKMIF